LTKQTLFFSATMPPEIQRWPTSSCSARRIEAQALSSTAETVTQYAYSPATRRISKSANACAT
jgi:superfamily II DNA/RNA helicase